MKLRNIKSQETKLSISKESSLPFLCKALHKKGLMIEVFNSGFECPVFIYE